MAERFHPAWEKVKAGRYRPDRYGRIDPSKPCFAETAMARNCNQMLGADLNRKADLVVCWTEGGQAKGGTGQALRIAQQLGVPVLNLGDPALATLSAADIVRRAEAVIANSGKEAAGSPRPQENTPGQLSMLAAARQRGR